MIGRLLLMGGLEVKVVVDGLITNRQASLKGSRDEVIGYTHMIEWISKARMNGLEGLVNKKAKASISLGIH